MTEKEKNQIIELRNQGKGYKQIAKALNLPVSSVSSFVLRNKESSQIKECLCKNCGVKLIQTKGHRQKLYCSDKCRREWWKNNQDKVNRLAFHDCVCLECGIAFRSYSKANRKYCSQGCYQKARFKGGNSDE